MCISHSVMEGSDIITPLTRVAFVYNGPKGMELLTHAIVEAAKALGGSFKLVMLVPKTVFNTPMTYDWSFQRLICPVDQLLHWTDNEIHNNQEEMYKMPVLMYLLSG